MERIPSFDLFSIRGKMMVRKCFLVLALSGLIFCFVAVTVFNRDPENNWNAGFALYGIASGCIVFYSFLIFFVFKIIDEATRPIILGCVAFAAFSLSVPSLLMSVISLLHIDWVRGEVAVDRFYRTGWGLAGLATVLLITFFISLGALLKQRGAVSDNTAGILQAAPSILVFLGFPACMFIVGLVYASTPVLVAGAVIMGMLVLISLKTCC
eukprot:gnl/Chilomastix_cuspidata/8396.p1 GENE.gnl/Chilomastix_cuspidata/8396~~gnl/Chilomastix_cuspidata/8396.p1  ORF type:complete len:231 (-),score=63.83 gnl/Chilomastix_cuspidata/8396:386-1018(-)